MAMELPDKFTTDERDAHKWLIDTGTDGWLVDLRDKSVFVLGPNDESKTYKSLTEFATELGWRK